MTLYTSSSSCNSRHNLSSSFTRCFATTNPISINWASFARIYFNTGYFPLKIYTWAFELSQTFIIQSSWSSVSGPRLNKNITGMTQSWYFDIALKPSQTYLNFLASSNANSETKIDKVVFYEYVDPIYTISYNWWSSDNITSNIILSGDGIYTHSSNIYTFYANWVTWVYLHRSDSLWWNWTDFYNKSDLYLSWNFSKTYTWGASNFWVMGIPYCQSNTINSSFSWYSLVVTWSFNSVSWDLASSYSNFGQNLNKISFWTLPWILALISALIVIAYIIHLIFRRKSSI